MLIQDQSQRNLFIEHLEELWAIEYRTLEAMPTIMDKVTDMGLKRILALHYAETLNQTSALRGIFKQLEITIEGSGNEAFDTLIAEAAEQLQRDDLTTPEEADLLVIAICRKIEEYEITRYSAAAFFARALGLEGVFRTLQTVLTEEKLAKVKLNFAAKNIAERQPDEIAEHIGH